MAADTDILFCGDPHGKFTQIVSAIKTHKPKAVVLLGDIEATRPLHEEIPFMLGAEVYWIPGNHEHENPDCWNNLIKSRYGKNNISGKVVEIDGIRIAGLGGVFHSKVWYPPGEEAVYNLDEWQDKNRFGNQYFEAQYNMHSMGTIFPEDYYAAATSLSADILVAHEAPSCHPYGFEVMDELARSIGARSMFHGHHHDNLDYSSHTGRLGFSANGVGLHGIKSISGADIVRGMHDDRRAEMRLKM